MFGSAILDTLIGLIFIFLLVSLIVSAATELISGWLSWRASNLWLGIRNLLDSPGTQIWASKLYDHALIQGLSKSWSKRFSIATLLAPAAKGPSYIPSRTFALALLDLVQEGDASIGNIRKGFRDILAKIATSDFSVVDLEREITALIGTIPDSGPVSARLKSDLQSLVENIRGFVVPLDKLRNEIQILINNIPDLDSSRSGLKRELQRLVTKLADPGYSHDDLKRDIQNLIIKVPSSASTTQLARRDLQSLIGNIPDRVYYATLAKSAIQDFADRMPERYFRDVLKQIGNPQLLRTLNVLLEESDHNLEEFKKNIEIWFNDSMDRVSGWYKRKTQLAHLFLGVLFTFALNLDAIVVVKALSQNTAMRESLVAQAQKFAEEPPVQIYAATPAMRSLPSQPSPPQESRQPGAVTLVLSSDSVVGGDSLKGKVSLGSAAPPGGTAVSIHTTNPQVATVIPDRVTILEGATSADFQVTTKPAAVTTSVTLFAEGATASAALTVNPSTEEKYRLLRGELERLSLPLGWVFAKPAAAQTEEGEPAGNGDNQDFRVWPGWLWQEGKFGLWRDKWWHTVRYHFTGWALTAIAISLGAPFWFDLLNKVVAIRSSGKVPEKEPKTPNELTKAPS